MADLCKETTKKIKLLKCFFKLKKNALNWHLMTDKECIDINIDYETLYYVYTSKNSNIYIIMHTNYDNDLKVLN